MVLLAVMAKPEIALKVVQLQQILAAAVLVALRIVLLAVLVLLSFVIHKHSHLQHQLQEMYKLVMLQDIKYILGLLQVQLHFKLQ